MVPILKSLLSQKTRQTKGWVKRVELHLSPDKAGYSNHQSAIRKLVINSFFSCHLLWSPRAAIMILGKSGRLSVSPFPICEEVAIALPHLMEEFCGWNSWVSEGGHLGHVQSLPSTGHIAFHSKFQVFNQSQLARCVHVTRRKHSHTQGKNRVSAMKPQHNHRTEWTPQEGHLHWI